MACAVTRTGSALQLRLTPQSTWFSDGTVTLRARRTSDLTTVLSTTVPYRAQGWWAMCWMASGGYENGDGEWVYDDEGSIYPCGIDAGVVPIGQSRTVTTQVNVTAGYTRPIVLECYTDRPGLGCTVGGLTTDSRAVVTLYEISADTGQLIASLVVRTSGPISDPYMVGTIAARVRAGCSTLTGTSIAPCDSARTIVGLGSNEPRYYRYALTESDASVGTLQYSCTPSTPLIGCTLSRVGNSLLARVTGNNTSGYLTIQGARPSAPTVPVVTTQTSVVSQSASLGGDGYVAFAASSSTAGLGPAERREVTVSASVLAPYVARPTDCLTSSDAVACTVVSADPSGAGQVTLALERLRGDTTPVTAWYVLRGRKPGPPGADSVTTGYGQLTVPLALGCQTPAGSRITPCDSSVSLGYGTSTQVHAFRLDEQGADVGQLTYQCAPRGPYVSCALQRYGDVLVAKVTGEGSIRSIRIRAHRTGQPAEPLLEALTVPINPPETSERLCMPGTTPAGPYPSAAVIRPACVPMAFLLGTPSMMISAGGSSVSTFTIPLTGQEVGAPRVRCVSTRPSVACLASMPNGTSVDVAAYGFAVDSVEATLRVYLSYGTGASERLFTAQIAAAVLPARSAVAPCQNALGTALTLCDAPQPMLSGMPSGTFVRINRDPYAYTWTCRAAGAVVCGSRYVPEWTGTRVYPDGTIIDGQSGPLVLIDWDNRGEGTGQLRITGRGAAAGDTVAVVIPVTVRAPGPFAAVPGCQSPDGAWRITPCDTALAGMPNDHKFVTYRWTGPIGPWCYPDGVVLGCGINTIGANFMDVWHSPFPGTIGKQGRASFASYYRSLDLLVSSTATVNVVSTPVVEPCTGVHGTALAPCDTAVTIARGDTARVTYRFVPSAIGFDLICSARGVARCVRADTLTADDGRMLYRFHILGCDVGTTHMRIGARTKSPWAFTDSVFATLTMTVTEGTRSCPTLTQPTPGFAVALAPTVAPPPLPSLPPTSTNVPWVDAVGAGSGLMIRRDVCVRVALGDAAASECGDLRLAHALGSVTTRGKTYAPTLAYVSEHAHPRPIVRANVALPDNLPAGLTGASPVTTRLLDGSGQVVVTRIDSIGAWGPQTATGVERVRMVALPFDATTLRTGVYPMRVRVSLGGESGGGGAGSNPLETTANTQVVIVNRDTVATATAVLPNAFGRGWWLLGYERLYALHPPGGPSAGADSLLWVGGDGNATVYVRRADSVFTAAVLFDRPDTLVQRSAGGWARLLPGRRRVVFDTRGWHERTEGRLALDVTSFEHESGTGRLLAVSVPPASAGLRYEFAYGPIDPGTGTPRQAADDALSRVQLVRQGPGGTRTLYPERTTRVQSDSGFVTSIRDPDGSNVEFRYEGTGGMRGVVTARLDRKGVRRSFTFDVLRGLRTSGVVVATPTGPQAAQTTLCAGEVATLVDCNTGTLRVVPVSPYDVVTRLDGPRPATDAVDVTRIAIDRFGQPWRVENAAGDESGVERTGDWPALATRTLDFDRVERRAGYDASGHLVADSLMRPLGADPTVYPRGVVEPAVTRYEWHSKWSALTKLVTPEQVTTWFGYDDTGNRSWQQVGPGAGASAESDKSRRTNFSYDESGFVESGLLRNVLYPSVEGFRRSETLAYDAVGNVRRVTGDSAGVTLTDARQGRDPFGQVVADSVLVSRSPAAWQVTRRTPDVMGQDSVTVSIGPALAGVAEQRITVTTLRDAEGNPRSVARSVSPDPHAAGSLPLGTITTQWEYDELGRKTLETAPDGRQERREYDLAGNVKRDSTRRGHVIEMSYDARNLLRTRFVPGVFYGVRNAGIALQHESLGGATGDPNRPAEAYPGYPNDGGSGYQIVPDLETFDYDAAGRLTRADNRDARVRRSYFPSGAVETETQQIRTVRELADGGDFTSHRHTLRYRYDLDGRRTALVQPPVLNGGAPRDRTSYAYDPVTGDLQSATTPLGETYEYVYDFAGRVEVLKRPGGADERYTYDGTGALRTQRVRNGCTVGYCWDGPFLRSTTFDRDPLGRVLASRNTTGTAESTTASYSGLGYLVTSTLRSDAVTAWGLPGYYQVNEQYVYDALGNRRSSTVSTTRSSPIQLEKTVGPGGTAGYIPNTGRAAYFNDLAERDTLYYDAAGNTEWMTRPRADAQLADRASYYGADQRLRATDTRDLSKINVASFFYRSAFEEYRYDALGRRVWVRARRWCFNDPAIWASECQSQRVRRTLWDGDHELWEVQMPGEDDAPDAESDTTAVPRSRLGTVGAELGFDPNAMLGRVLYTHGLSTDQPLGVTRFGYGDLTGTANPRDKTSATVWKAHRADGPFTLSPLWNAQGVADLGVFADGALERCRPDAAQAALSRCVYRQWPALLYAYARAANARRLAWHGSVLEDKRDASGLLHRRARQYDPSTGRFTQEDPIGLAGGVNLYGYADGDPVNLDDPFGLCTIGKDCWQAFKTWLHSDDGHFFERFNGGMQAAGRMANPAMLESAGAVGMAARAAAAEEVTAPVITQAYRRPANATTAAQRASVQGRPCVTCGNTANRMVADHRTPLVQEYYETGTIDQARMRSLGAVQPQCPTCSARQGAEMSRYSKQMRQQNGLPEDEEE